MLDDTEKIVRKLRKDVKAGIIIVCEIDVEEDRWQVISHSSSAVRKKMPGRTLSMGYRLVSDSRQINLGNGKHEFYPVVVAKMTDIAARILKLQKQYPTLPVLMAKRDIANALRRILLRPDLIHIFTTDILGDRLGRRSDLFMGHLAMPFGWVVSPAYFKLHTDAITAVRNFSKHG